MQTCYRSCLSTCRLMAWYQNSSFGLFDFYHCLAHCVSDSFEHFLEFTCIAELNFSCTSYFCKLHAFRCYLFRQTCVLLLKCWNEEKKQIMIFWSFSIVLIFDLRFIFDLQGLFLNFRLLCIDIYVMYILFCIRDTLYDLGQKFRTFWIHEETELFISYPYTLCFDLNYNYTCTILHG